MPVAGSTYGDSVEETADNPKFSAPEDDAGALPPGIIALEVKFLCRECATKLIVGVQWQGYRLKCPHCGAPNGVPDCSEILQAPAPARNSGADVPRIVPELTAAEVEYLSGRAS